MVIVDAADGCEAPEVAGAGEVSEFGGVDPSVFAFEPDAVHAVGGTAIGPNASMSSGCVMPPTMVAISPAAILSLMRLGRMSN